MRDDGEGERKSACGAISDIASVGSAGATISSEGVVAEHGVDTIMAAFVDTDGAGDGASADSSATRTHVLCTFSPFRRSSAAEIDAEALIGDVGLFKLGLKLQYSTRTVRAVKLEYRVRR